MYTTPWTPVDVIRMDDNVVPSTQEATATNNQRGKIQPPKRCTMQDTGKSYPQKNFVCVPTSLPRAAEIATG